MTAAAEATPSTMQTPAMPKPRIGLIPALTVFLSAFLLFQVQPLMGKFILPWFGGGPSVWMTCLLFFQVALLAGYAYAHLVVSRLSPRTQAWLHAGLLLAVVVATLPIIPPERWKPPDPLNPSRRIILLLAVSVGLPFFALATTAPLLQAWVARLDGRVAPYRLYALSNMASILALVSYPFLIEPMLARREQAWVWSALFVVFAIGCAFCAMRASRLRDPIETSAAGIGAANPQSTNDGAAISETTPAGSPDQAPSLFQRAMWVALPACASALLLGTTNMLTQDVAAVPFLWVLPLALYLLTFVLAFDHPRWYSRRICGPLLILIVGPMLWAMYRPLSEITLGRMILIYSGGLFVACLMCHGELSRVRPHPGRLTGYYLAIAAGGAIGGAFVSIVAPMIFTRYLELGISLWACCALILVIAATDRRSWLRGLRPPIAWVGLVAGMVLVGYLVWANEPAERGTILVARMRNFYGVLRVFEKTAPDDDGLRLRLLQHGRTTHGVQALNPSLRRAPLSYYGPRSGVGQAMQQLEQRPSCHVGVIGLGVGSISALMREGDRIRFYEIDPNVLYCARTFFTYLADSPAEVHVVLGDGRLSLEREPPQQFDLLALDAFSSDAIPVHLLTKEAFAIYRRHVKPNGLFAIHISNRHLDLRPLVAGLAQAFGLRVFFSSPDLNPGEGGEYASTWAILEPSSTPIVPRGDEVLWTDERANLVSVLKRGKSQK
ncbi:MAG TPA: fused MFS/spermidine synthase [Tepidisphaeraceae bacterium]|nr:fused MFS/spermidine synthase [Tepidisphaeraceae bacterium]